MTELKIKHLALFIVFLLPSCKDKREKTKPVVEKISESVYASGIIKSKNQYQVFSTVNGLVKDILLREGDIVKNGDLLMVIQNETSGLNAENARLAAAFADINSNADKLNEFKLSIDLAGMKMRNDSMLAVRQRNLWSTSIGTLNDLEQRELAYKNASASYQSLLLRYNDLKRQLNLASEQSKRNLQISRSIEDDYQIKSRTDGRIYSILKEKGELVTPQSPVAVIGDSSEFFIELQVDEYDISKIKAGQRVLFSLDSYKGEVFEAEIYSIEPIMNERTRSFTVKAIFVTRPGVLYPFLTVEANIILNVKEKALTIPINYLIDGSYVLNENMDSLKVVTGLKDYEKVEIVSGISEGEVIVKPLK
ncbi:MAG: efflux RND transporter periplasmic adaptor subunit [Bacteroidetes bacterium]|nr:efflux RND transporter periplasmic adaptor subunit [Bacteroidota bacterium]